jgi:hypothetical protein
MNELGFQRLVSDAGLFVCKDYKEIIIAIVYVDDAMARTRLKSTPRRNSLWTNGNAVTWEKSRNSYTCVSHEKKKIFILTSMIILTKC